MPSRRLTLSIALTTVALLVLVPPASASAAGRVIGGTKVEQPDFEARWRATVSIGWRTVADAADAHLCGGVLIGDRLVLTARHCVESGMVMTDASDLTVYGGAASLHGGGTRVNVDAIHRTRGIPGQSYFVTGDDLAILELAQPIPGATVVVPARDEHAAWWGDGAGRANGVFVAGWGITRDASIRLERTFGPASSELLSAELPVIGTEACAAQVKWDPSVRRHICAGTLEIPSTSVNEGRTACYGDSGGPLLATDPAGIEPPRLVGIVSRGTHMECSSGIGIYAPVARRAEWIDGIVAGSAENPVLRAAEPTVTLSPQRAYGHAAFKVHRAVAGDRYRVEMRPAGWSIWLRIGWSYEVGSSPWNRTGPWARFIAGPTRAGRMDLRVVRMPSNGLERVIARRTVGSQVDAAAPGRIARVVAKRQGPFHYLTWSAATDRRDRVLGYVIEQRPRGARAWRYEYFSECESCYFGTATKPSLRSGHVLLPGRRQFRVAAVDRAGNRGPWTVSP